MKKRIKHQKQTKCPLASKGIGPDKEKKRRGKMTNVQKKHAKDKASDKQKKARNRSKSHC